MYMANYQLNLISKQLTDLPTIPGVYKFLCRPTNKFYIGGTKNIRKRLKEHMTLLRNGHHLNEHFQRSFLKYGVESFDFYIIECCNENNVFDREQYYLNEGFKTPLLIFNTQKNTRYSGIVSIETRRKLSKKNKGRIITTEQREKISRSLKGIKRTIEVKKKMREAQIQVICKPFKIVDKNGKLYNGLCIADFAKEHNINLGNYTTGLRAVISKRRKQYEGWHLPETKFPILYNIKTNIKEIIWNQREFGRKYHIHNSDVNKLLKGKLDHKPKGWILTKEIG